MNSKRRIFLRGTVTGSAVALAIGAGLIQPRQVLAAWPKGAFEAKSVDDAVNGIFGGNAAKASDAIDIKAPDIAENGAVVPVTIETTLAGVTAITLISEQNGTPLAASFNLSANTAPFVSTRIKMAKTSNVIALVKTNDGLFSARKEVKVTIGGCGG